MKITIIYRNGKSEKLEDKEGINYSLAEQGNFLVLYKNNYYENRLISKKYIPLERIKEVEIIE